jgi:putative heme-binding domain-containing protein
MSPPFLLVLCSNAAFENINIRSTGEEFMRFVYLSLAVALLCFACTNPTFSDQAADPYAAFISPTGPLSPEEERRKFHLPPGFDVQLVAAEPNVRKPININFDDRGRLWVTESIEYPFPAKPDRVGRDSIRILDDKNDDGPAEEVTTFTSGLNIPIGVLPMGDGAIAYSIPNIYRLRATNGGDKANAKEFLYGTFGHDDTHGMTGEFTWGFDGWVYACHGFANTSHVKGKDGHTITMQSGSTYRFRPDGSRVEYFTHGQVNPFGLTIDPFGNLYSCDCHSRPIYMLLRGAYYPSFGKPHDGLDFGPEMMTHDHGSTAIAGITYYAADHFPQAYQGTVFVGNVVTNRINHDRLEKHGSSVLAIQQPDFLISDDPWFRPVDIKLGPDGALYVADFYNRIIGHYEVPLTHPGRDHERGRIWRIIYRGPDGKGYPHQHRPDWSKASVSDLVDDLAHPNLTVRIKATNQLVARGAAAAGPVVRVMHPDSSPFQRAHGLWVLERIGKLDDETLKARANDSEAIVRVHAMRILAERPTLSTGLHELALKKLEDMDPLVERCAADALGRHPSQRNLVPLLDLRSRIPQDDTHLLHVVRMALRDQLQTPDAFAAIRRRSWKERDLRYVADAAVGAHHRASAEFVLNHLEHSSGTSENRQRYAAHVARYGDDRLEAELVHWARNNLAGTLTQHARLFRSIFEGTQARGGHLNDEGRAWGIELCQKLLHAQTQKSLLLGVELAGLMNDANLQAMLYELASSKAAEEDVRGAALDALVSLNANHQSPSDALPRSVLIRLMNDPSESPAIRDKAAAHLAAIREAVARNELVKTLAVAPKRLAVSIATGLAQYREGAAALLSAVQEGKASPRLLQERAVESRLSQSQVDGWKERVAVLTRDLPAADKRFQELLRLRHRGFAASRADSARGAKVFEKNCANCHQLANKGARIGPQLDGIGIRGLDRLLEDIIDPSRNVDQAFRLTTLELKNGQIVAGLVLREEGKVLVLADAQGKEVRIEKENIETRQVSQLSPMPANLVDQIPESDFYDLLAFLLSQRPKDGSAARKAGSSP